MLDVIIARTVVANGTCMNVKIAGPYDSKHLQHMRKCQEEMLLVMDSLVTWAVSSLGGCFWFWMRAEFKAGMDAMDALAFGCAGSMNLIIAQVQMLLVMGALATWMLSPFDVLEFACAGSMGVVIGFPCSDADAQFPMRAAFRFLISDSAVSVGRWVWTAQFVIRGLASAFFS